MACLAFSFGSFELFPHRALLLRNGNRVALGSRALAILTLLIERSGELVSTKDIVNYVWPGIFVEESNLRVQMTSLRKALGDVHSDSQFILNEPGARLSFFSFCGLPAARYSFPCAPKSYKAA